MSDDHGSQTFNGFEPPTANFSKLPHGLIDQLPRFSTKGELAVVLYVLRHTFGFHEYWKRITLDEFENGRRRKDGSRIDGGVGMGREAVIKGVRRAVQHGFLNVHTDDRDGGRVRKLYALNVDVQAAPPSGRTNGRSSERSNGRSRPGAGHRQQ